MKTYEQSITLTCDKCKKNVGNLNPLYLQENSYDPSYSCSHEFLMDLCDDCFTKLVSYLGEFAMIKLIKLSQKNSFKNYNLML